MKGVYRTPRLFVLICVFGVVVVRLGKTFIMSVFLLMNRLCNNVLFSALGGEISADKNTIKVSGVYRHISIDKLIA